jgi:hypothetical protein
VPKDVTTTQDLADRTDFNTYTNGLYNLPHAQLKDAAYGPSLKPLNVIIVPHSHLDPGWLETVDEYYNRKVKFILDHMVRKLHLYPDMTFIWAEIIFLHRWWGSQSKLIQEQFHELIKSGMLLNNVCTGKPIKLSVCEIHVPKFVVERLLYFF